MTDDTSRYVERNLRTVPIFYMLFSTKPEVMDTKKNLRYVIMRPGITLIQPNGHAHCVVLTFEDPGKLSLVFGWEGIDVTDKNRTEQFIQKYVKSVNAIEKSSALFSKAKFGHYV